MGSNRRCTSVAVRFWGTWQSLSSYDRLIITFESFYFGILKGQSPAAEITHYKTQNKSIQNNQHIIKTVSLSLCLQVLQAQVDSLIRGEGDIIATCTQTEEAMAGEACVASLQMERELVERLVELARFRLPYQPEENDQLDLLMETDGLRKSIHNLGTIVTTRCDRANTKMFKPVLYISIFCI